MCDGCACILFVVAAYCNNCLLIGYSFDAPKRCLLLKNVDDDKHEFKN